MPRIFADGPLTVAPALTTPVPKGSYNPKGDVAGTNPVGLLAVATETPDGVSHPHPYVQPSASSLGAATTKPLPVSLHNIPGQPDPEAVFVITGSTDMGVYFTQGQLDHWQDLMFAIENGLLTATAAGTIPAVAPSAAL